MTDADRLTHTWPSVLLLFVTALGCGSNGPEKATVTGTVTFAGKPIEFGMIKFNPIEGTSGPFSSAAIKNGEYRIDNKGGVPVGRHRVQIDGYRKAIVAPPGLPLEEAPPDQYIPAKYNSASELTEEIRADESPAIRNYTLE